MAVFVRKREVVAVAVFPAGGEVNAADRFTGAGIAKRAAQTGRFRAGFLGHEKRVGVLVRHVMVAAQRQPRHSVRQVGMEFVPRRPVGTAEHARDGAAPLRTGDDRRIFRQNVERDAARLSRFQNSGR